jgi:hypothetical protein
MKKIILIMLLLTMSATSFSQPKTETSTVKADYLQKSKNHKATAWVMLGGGAAFILLGDLIGNSKKSSFSDAGTGFVIAGIGALSMLGSIPLFIAASGNKRKAKTASAFFRMETVPVIQQSGTFSRSIPVVAIKIRL